LWKRNGKSSGRKGNGKYSRGRSGIDMEVMLIQLNASYVGKNGVNFKE